MFGFNAWKGIGMAAMIAMVSMPLAAQEPQHGPGPGQGRGPGLGRGEHKAAPAPQHEAQKATPPTAGPQKAAAECEECAQKTDGGKKAIKEGKQGKADRQARRAYNRQGRTGRPGAPGGGFMEQGINRRQRMQPFMQADPQARQNFKKRMATQRANRLGMNRGGFAPQGRPMQGMHAFDGRLHMSPRMGMQRGHQMQHTPKMGMRRGGGQQGHGGRQAMSGMNWRGNTRGMGMMRQAPAFGGGMRRPMWMGMQNQGRMEGRTQHGPAGRGAQHGFDCDAQSECR